MENPLKKNIMKIAQHRLIGLLSAMEWIEKEAAWVSLLIY